MRSVILPKAILAKRRVLSLCLPVPAGLLALSLLFTALTPQDSAASFTSDLARSGHEISQSLQGQEERLVSPEQGNLTSPISPTEMISDMLGQVNGDRALNDLRRLTGETTICVDNGCHTIINRVTGGEGLAWAMEYLYENLVSLGYSVEMRDWSRSGWADQNLIARKQGVITPTEEVYLIAHVDGVGSSSGRRPAADDNASSVVNGLELARVFSPYTFGRTIVLFFSTGEEQGTLGALEYLAHLSPQQLSAIKYAVNRDVTGYDANGDTVMELLHGDHPPSQALAQMMSETIYAYQLALDPRSLAGCP